MLLMQRVHDSLANKWINDLLMKQVLQWIQIEIGAAMTLGSQLEAIFIEFRPTNWDKCCNEKLKYSTIEFRPTNWSCISFVSNHGFSCDDLFCYD